MPAYAVRPQPVAHGVGRTEQVRVHPQARSAAGGLLLPQSHRSCTATTSSAKPLPHEGHVVEVLVPRPHRPDREHVPGRGGEQFGSCVISTATGRPQVEFGQRPPGPVGAPARRWTRNSSACSGRERRARAVGLRSAGGTLGRCPGDGLVERLHEPRPRVAAPGSARVASLALGRDRAAVYEAARDGGVDVVVGTRAAALLPLPGLGSVRRGRAQRGPSRPTSFEACPCTPGGPSRRNAVASRVPGFCSCPSLRSYAQTLGPKPTVGSCRPARAIGGP